MITRPDDVEQLTLLYKMTRELARRMPAYRGEVAAHHPKFSPDSPAACREADGPVPINAPDIVYSGADDEAIAKFNRDVGESSLSDHSCFPFLSHFTHDDCSIHNLALGQLPKGLFLWGE